MNTRQKYNPEITSNEECLRIVKSEGAILLCGFIGDTLQNEVINDFNLQSLPLIDRTQHIVPERFYGAEWDLNDAPASTQKVGEKICNFVHPVVDAWIPNTVQGRLYEPGQIAVDWHRDYKRDLRLVAIASFINKALFEVELSSGRASWIVEPGDLILLRHPLLFDGVDDRPLHRAEAPHIGNRLSIVFRQEALLPSELAANNELNRR